MALALVSGLIYALSFPPFGLRWMVLPSLCGLLMALRNPQRKRVWPIGFLYGMAAYSLSLSWMFHLFGTAAIALWGILAIFTAFFAEMQVCATRRGLPGWLLILFTALNWSACEFIRAELFPLKFPWMTVGLAIGPNALLPWIGVYGVGTFFILPAVLIIAGKWKVALPACAILAATVFLQRPAPAPDPASPQTLRMAGIQDEGVSIDAYINATKKLPPDTQYVVWPECAVPYDLNTYPKDEALIKGLCQQQNFTLTFGSKLQEGNGDAWRNIALTMDATGTRGFHNKVHTVHFFDDGIAGKTALPIETAHGKIGTPVCFDCDYEGIIRRMTAAGAELFAIPIMDASSWTASQHEQHAELFRIRAAENGRWCFVTSTSGVSQLIDPHGSVHARLPLLEPGTMTGLMKRETALTFYTRFGWLTPWVTLSIAGACWVALLFKRKDA